ncbi:MAG TPA: response regulator [Longimicrobiales bacterium]|nr:response regulator [Longimicrobiales bacterium]
MLILIVEDNADNRDIFRTILEYSGHRVLVAETGMAGLDLASEHEPDLILLDIELPDISGLTVRRALYGSERTRAIPVFAVTAHELAHVVEHSRGATFDRVIRKPIEPRALVTVIAEWASGRGDVAAVRPLDA